MLAFVCRPLKCNSIIFMESFSLFHSSAGFVQMFLTYEKALVMLSWRSKLADLILLKVAYILPHIACCCLWSRYNA